jgi:heme-degrading monooxygenase HmoA
MAQFVKQFHGFFRFNVLRAVKGPDPYIVAEIWAVFATGI